MVETGGWLKVKRDRRSLLRAEAEDRDIKTLFLLWQ